MAFLQAVRAHLARLVIPSPSAHPPGSGASATGQGGAPCRTNDLDPRRGEYIDRKHRLFAFYHVAAYTGARRGELLNLRWADIDLDGKKITITGSTGIIDGERVDGTTKSGRSRVATIDDETVAIFKEHRKAQAADQLLAGESWRGNEGGHVFTTGWATPTRRSPSACTPM